MVKRRYGKLFSGEDVTGTWIVCDEDPFYSGDLPVKLLLFDPVVVDGRSVLGLAVVCGQESIYLLVRCGPFGTEL